MTDDTSREKGLELEATANHTTDSFPGRWEDVRVSPRAHVCVCHTDEMLGIDASLCASQRACFVCMCVSEGRQAGLVLSTPQ